MGLGLTSARSGFRAHGGDVTLSNVVGGGLRATVVLPLSPDQPELASRPGESITIAALERERSPL
jgi:K+-sensing histidine kinase KdpD